MFFYTNIEKPLVKRSMLIRSFVCFEGKVNESKDCMYLLKKPRSKKCSCIKALSGKNKATFGRFFWLIICLTNTIPRCLYTLTIKQATAMSANQYLLEYTSFLKWFQDNYPALCRRYCREIFPPTSDAGVIINRRNLDTDIYNMLVHLSREYYSSLKND